MTTLEQEEKYERSTTEKEEEKVMYALMKMGEPHSKNF